MLTLVLHKTIRHKLDFNDRTSYHAPGTYNSRGLIMMSVSAMLGFTTLQSTLWNLAAYAAFVGIIVGVLYERARNILLTVGGGMLACYSAFFLKNTLFPPLQIIVTVSGALQLYRVDRRKTIVTMSALTFATLVVLTFIGALQNAILVVGIGGLLGIALGIMLLPRRSAFALMTTGGILLVAYAWSSGAWVFFWLNIFFALANIKELVTARA